MTVTILKGDCRDVLRGMPTESVHCIVTSPPYFGLRDYGMAGQIGLEPTPAAYVAELVNVLGEARRVLRDDGTLFLNLGDSYWTSGPRHTGRNDTERETPGGRGGSFRGGVRRAIACDTPYKAPEGSPESGCFCQSLCGACREAYQIGKSHSGHERVSRQPASNSESIPEHTGSPLDHLPTSDLARPDDRSAVAILDLPPTPRREDGLLHVSQASMIGESAQLSHALHSTASSRAGGCRLCGRSLLDCAPASAYRAACICDIAAGGSGAHMIGKGALGSAYPDYTTAFLKPKDLIGIPWRVAFALQADGWYLRQDIIWSKPNPMPESVRDRCTKAHEYLFLLSKCERYYYDAEAIAEPAEAAGEFRKFNTSKKAARVVDGGLGSGNEHPDAPPVLVGDTRNRRSVWEVTTQPFPEAHFATFPPALIEPCIRAGCPKGGTVLDPFGGAGTTALVADREGRNGIIIEINPEYAAMAERRIKGDAGMFADVAAE